MIHFNSKEPFYKSPFGAIEKNTDLFLRIRVEGDRSVSSALIYLIRDENGSILKLEGKTANNNRIRSVSL
jgi:hypothetical protein